MKPERQACRGPLSRLRGGNQRAGQRRRPRPLRGVSRRTRQSGQAGLCRATQSGRRGRVQARSGGGATRLVCAAKGGRPGGLFGPPKGEELQVSAGEPGTLAGVEARGACPPDGGPGSPCPNAGTQAGFVSRSQGGEKGDRERHYGLAGPKAPIAGMPAPACAGHVAPLRAAAGVFRQNPVRQMSGGGRSAVRT